MQIPSLDDWGPVNPDDLDAASAYETFLGKSYAQARELFSRNALFYQEELGSMPPTPFRFYVRAFMDYLNGEDSAGDSDGASSFLFLFQEVLERFRGHLDDETEALMLTTARRVSSRQDFYEADLGIYDSFPDRLGSIEKLCMAPNITLERTRER